MKKIFSMAIANGLLQKGFKIIKIETNRKYNKCVFIFESSNYLEREVSRILKEYERDKSGENMTSI